MVLDAVRRALPHLVGLGAYGLIVAGVWGSLGWQAAAIVAGLPFAGFWIWSEARKMSRGEEVGA